MLSEVCGVWLDGGGLREGVGVPGDLVRLGIWRRRRRRKVGALWLLIVLVPFPIDPVFPVIPVSYP